MLKRTIAAVGFALLGSCAPVARAPSSPGAIAWHSFGPAAFEEARRTGKLVMVDAGIEGCTACRWMHEGAYHDASVIRRIQDGFVAVSVDADQEPDLGDRFLPWGWPATIFFAPDGRQVYALQGSESGAEFAKLLDDLSARKRAGTLAKAQSSTGHGEWNANLAAACIDSRDRLDSMGDAWGWGGEERVALVGPFEDALIRARSRGDAKIGARGLAQANGEARLLDAVWGGIFVGSYGKQWDNPIPEKRTLFNAAALDAFALELQRTGDAAWKKRADLVRKYLEDWMRAPDGTFYSTQQDAAPGLPPNKDASDYYALDDAGRRAWGIPHIDHGVYTDQNALVVQGYVRLYDATGDATVLAVARRAADALLATRTRADGGMDQVDLTSQLAGDERLRPTLPDSRLYLKAQGEMGLALLALHEATGEARYLDAARKIAAALGALEDAAGGGFYGTTARDVDALVARKKPFVDNVAAVRFLMRLDAVTRETTYDKLVDRTLAYLSPQVRYEGPWGTGVLALAYDERLLGPVEITIVRGGDDALATTLRDAMLRVYEPRKIVRLEDAGHYPKPKTGAAIYVCTRSACSSPTTSVEEARANVDRMTQASDAPCP